MFDFAHLQNTNRFPEEYQVLENYPRWAYFVFILIFTLDVGLILRPLFAQHIIVPVQNMK